MGHARATGTASLLGIACGAATISSIAAGQCGAITVEVAGWGQAGYHQTTLAPAPRHARAIAAGNQNSFAIREDGGISGWGLNGFYRVADAPVTIVDAIGLSAGETHVAALRADGSVSCWGNNSVNQCDVPPGLSAVLSLNAGRLHTVASDSSGAVWCWGRTAEGQCTPPADLGPVSLVAAGRFHSVALKRTGTVRCWGWNTDGQCNVPPGLAGVVAIGTGAVHTMAVRSDGGVVAWGSNASGQRNVPAGLGPVTAVDGGEGHSVALLADRTVACWGSNSHGQASVPADLGPVVAIAAGSDHTLALEEGGAVRAWGGNEHAQRNVPIDLGSVRSIDVNTYHSIAVGSTGQVMAWGLNTSGACNVPPGLAGVVEVAAGDGHSMALDSDGRVTCWGVDFDGQSTVPPGLNATPIARIRAGSYHSIAIEFLPGGLAPLRCWGRNDQGQCDGSGTLVRDADGGFNFTIAIRSDGQATGWGGNEHGQITVPPDPGTLVSVSAGDYHVLGLRSDGTVRAWGWNANGQAIVPGGLGPVQAVAAGRTHSMALLATGLVRVWGGDPGGSGHFLVPHALEPFTAIRAGRVHDLAIRVGADSDADGIEDAVDNCPCTANADQVDVDGDSAGDACDECPLDSRKALVGSCGCGVIDVDTDADLTPDCLDGCPRDPFKTEIGCGCGTPDPDSDGDGTVDCEDGCPTDPLKTSPGVCGCGEVERDLDNDGRIDCLETWTPEPPDSVVPADGEAGDRYGAATATDGTWLVIGVPGDAEGGGGGCGSVRMLERSGGAWVERVRLVAPVPAAGDGFGSSVAIDGDLLAVGSPGCDLPGAADAGAVDVFRLMAGTWVHSARLTRPGATATDAFGSSVAVRGELVAAGAPRADRGGVADSGEACVFVGSGSTWTLASTGGSLPPGRDDRYGSSLDFAADSTPIRLAVGAPRDDQPSRLNCGAVYLVDLDAAGVPLSTTRLASPGSLTNAELGRSVALDAAGITLAAGGPLADRPDGTEDSGFATVWILDGALWFGSTLFPLVPEESLRFGTSIDLDPSGGMLIVGSPGRTTGGVPGRGAATLFRRYGGMGWDLGTILADDAGGTGASHFGSAVAAGRETLVSGGPEHGDPAIGAVATFIAPVSCVGNDSDGDGLSDDCDACPGDITKTMPETCGCGVPETDSDLDGTPDCDDGCPTDPGKIEPGTCGCGVADVDTDLDTFLDCQDPDDDNDGVPDGSDGCPLDPSKSDPGLCGCGVADTDDDLDGTPACLDLCDEDPDKTEPGICGCGVADDDLDADGLVDCLGLGTVDESASIVAPDSLAGDDFGTCVATDGTLLVVGSPLDDVSGKTDAGSVAILARGESGEWLLEARLAAPTPRARESFGASVAIDPDTGSIVVGAPLTDVGALTDAGAAYRFTPDGSGGWTPVDTLHRTGASAGDRFGTAVAARGGLVAVGAPKANALALADSGEVRVYREEAGHLVVDLVMTGESAGDQFGQAVAFAAGSTNWDLVAGVPGDDEGSKTNCGAVHILSAVTGGGRTRLVAPSPVRNAALGTSIAIGGGGGMIAGGGPLADLPDVGTDCGQVVVWTFSGSAWTGVEIRPADHTAGERLGTSLAISDDTNWLVAGAPFDTVDGITQRGSAALFHREGTAWRTYDRLTLPPEGTSASRFGSSAATRSGTVFVGAPKHSPPAGGTVREFGLPPP